ncbi:hypothetical protein AUR65_013140 [Haloferax marisrubri]|uniref:Uncharacterized protein n=1 Tax=Haloferax marisrubri TaxID=1544719 RepID=A0A2P4NPD3_9EURY|nr:hypothetical protein AUR65_013140 [Haloferax marisrubri]
MPHGAAGMTGAIVVEE